MVAPRWAAVALCAAIPISTALDNLLLVILLGLALLGGCRQALHAALHNPVARAALLLFAALAVGISYGEASLGDGLGILGKYLDLAVMPLLMVAVRDDETRRHAMYAFLASMLVTALLSWLVGLGLLPVYSWMWKGCYPVNPAIFRGSITQSILMAFAVYLLLLLSREVAVASRKWGLRGLAMFVAGDILFLVQGKTGYLVLLALLACYAWHTMARYMSGRGRRIGWKEGMGLLLLGTTLAFAAYQASPRLHERVNLTIDGIREWNPEMRIDPTSRDRAEYSSVERMSFYYYTWRLISEHPLIGVGTGGFPAAYAKQVQGKAVEPTNNPHSEILLQMAQIGVAGLFLLLYLFYTQWRQASRLPDAFDQDAARGLVLVIAITALFNSPLYDHVEGLFFAVASALLFSSLTPGRRRG